MSHNWSKRGTYPSDIPQYLKDNKQVQQPPFNGIKYGQIFVTGNFLVFEAIGKRGNIRQMEATVHLRNFCK